MEEVYRVLDSNSDFGVKVTIGGKDPVYMNADEVKEYLEDKEVEVEFVEMDDSAIDLFVNGVLMSVEGVWYVWKWIYFIFHLWRIWYIGL